MARLAPRRAVRSLVAVLAAGALVATLPGSASAQPERPRKPGVAPQVPGYGQVAPPRVTAAKPLPKRAGKVPVAKPAAGKSKSAALLAAEAGLNDKVALRALVIGTNADDFGVPTWKTTLDRLGASYDVLYSAETPITTSTVVRPDGVGKYNAILLTNSMQVYESGGSWLNGIDPTEWNILWAYERNFGVRQASLYTSYGTWPEDYCLNSAGETSVGDTPLNVSLTPAGAQVFDYLKADVSLPLVQTYVYKTAIKPGCAAEATITDGTNVLGVRTTSTDGRERLALTFTSNQYLLQSDVLVYGLVRWATKGLHLGEQRHYLNVDVDDWFNSSDHYKSDGTIEYDPGFRVSAHDMVNLNAQQTALRTAYPQIGNFTFNLAYNGADIDPFAGNQCSPNGGIAELTATTKCLAGSFRWLNHTLNHPELNHTDYATSHGEILTNRNAGNAIGLTHPADVLKTPEYSGLGVYTVDPDDDTGVPVDHGLAGSNPNLLQAAKDLGVKYLHGNYSFNSHKPAHFNASIVHPLEPAVEVVPDWPTNIAYFVTAPDEETHFYNSFYGPNGRFPYWPTDRTYQQIIDYEGGIGLQHVASGSINSHTFHISNVRDYGNGRTLLTDWVENVVSRYAAIYSTPLLNLNWSDLGAYTSVRTQHFAQKDAGVDAVYDRSTGTIEVTSPAAGTVQLSGAQTAGSTTYGSDVTAPVALAANTAVTVTAVPRA
ncbi:Agd3-related carbohydrate-binding protein [Paractinoplanes rishiriensis]|uniref:Agd3 CBM87 domain-containing protein n=1 Tax=Paractinoplanes rishiriensis TaxID=1050105 RepID=A0A919JXU7_9ACTN|nr:hypothetical protein [Actinoplanes rishiriensis]GIE95500.1 hypothetical protein Ari01nite_29650 [Actinoplanes rishiriensis]